MKRLVMFLALLPLPVAADEIIAARTMAAGTVLTDGDLTLGTGAGAGTGLTPADAVGKQLRVAVYQGRPITTGQLAAPTLVARNQLVTLAYEHAALRIETEGRALGAGGAGDLIRVMNLNSRTTLTARVNADGTLTVAQR